ncbi:hypothetical protein OPU71_17005 [Niveibacterium sp. 24ML]|uniref:hypothetical protein n=1 Tax=Niveibacterium sp. 24ML TaxID=2985512 RepID=UPI0022709626|nr:hypothetical protein [Niveibacterium sp. 24ML]MCX9157825.1 hypothetical protein [Niveibacterium sp. 24ML]
MNSWLVKLNRTSGKGSNPQIVVKVLATNRAAAVAQARQMHPEHQSVSSAVDEGPV